MTILSRIAEWVIPKTKVTSEINTHAQETQYLKKKKKILKANGSTHLKSRDAGVLAISSSLLNASENCARRNKSDITGIDAIENPPYNTFFGTE